MDDRLALAIKYYQSSLDGQAAALVAEIMAEENPPRDAINLAATLAFEARDFEAAVMHCDRLLKSDSNDSHALLLKGRALSDLGRQDAALVCLESAVTVDPDLAATHYNLGWVRSRMGDTDSAIVAYRGAIARQDPYPVAWNNLGLLLEQVGDGAGAIDAFRTAVRQFPEFSMAHNNLGAVLAACGQLGDAEAAYKNAVKADPDNIDAITNLGVACLERCNVDGAVEAFEDVIARQAEHAAAVDNRLYVEIYRGDDDAALRAVHAAAEQNSGVTNELKQWPVDKNPDRALRVGFLSPDFRRHSVSFFALPLFEALDHTKIIPILISDVAEPDAITANYEKVAAEWHSVAGLPDDAVTTLLRGSKLDVLIDLAGRTTGNRLRAVASRVAPVQIMALGYPGPTGISTMDYWLCDPISNPVEMDTAYDRDRPLRLDRGLHVFAPPAAAPPVAPLPAQDSGVITFGSFNKLAKLSDETVSLWADVLNAVPDSRLLMKARALTDMDTANDVRARFEQNGIADNRIETRGWAAEDHDHLALYAGVDIALDTFPYNGTTTTCEALWMGVPVLTLCGQSHAARVGASLLASSGLSDWVMKTPAAFVAHAQARAADVASLAALRSSLRSRIASSALTDAPETARAYEHAIRQAWLLRTKATD